jgi:hypothetical protein
MDNKRRDTYRIYSFHVLNILKDFGLPNEPEYEYISLLKFDLRLPLVAQLQVAKKELKLYQEIYNVKQLPKAHLTGNVRENWSRHLRVIDAKDQGSTHEGIYAQFIEEQTGGDDDAMDEIYRGKQPRSIVSQWHSQALEVMEKASRSL